MSATPSMETAAARRNAAQALVATLIAHGVDRVFCVPGECFLAVLDTLYDTPAIDCIACRHEGGAGMMALADAKLTGRPGVAFVSRGPGATNVSIAIHVAEQDAVPLVVFVGQVERKDIGRNSFQEVDYKKTLGGMCKGVWEVTDGRDLAGVCAKAFARAQRGVPGPVLVSLPEDMQFDAAAGPALPHATPRRRAPTADAISRTLALLERAERPLMILGGAFPAGQNEHYSALAARVAEAFAIPVAAGQKNQHRFPNAHSHYAGHLGYNIPAAHLALVAPADLVIAVGTRLGDVTTQGYRFPAATQPAQPLVHVYPAAEALAHLYRPQVAVQSDCGRFLEALLARAPAPLPSPELSATRRDWIARLHDYVANLAHWNGDTATDGVVFGAVIHALNGLLPKDAIIVQDAGNHTGWVHRYFSFGGRETLLAASAGAMGFGMPGAVAASLRHPERQVVCIIGDGGLLMTGNELATAVQYGAKPLVIVSNNHSYGTIRQHQEKHFPGRVKATGLRNPDFVRWAEAFGVPAFRIARPEDVRDVLAQALAVAGPALVEVHTSLRHISAFATLPA